MWVAGTSFNLQLHVLAAGWPAVISGRPHVAVLQKPAVRHAKGDNKPIVKWTPKRHASLGVFLLASWCRRPPGSKDGQPTTVVYCDECADETVK